MWIEIEFWVEMSNIDTSPDSVQISVLSKNTRLWTKSGLLPIVDISDFERIFETYKIAMTMIISPLTAVLLM